MASSFVDEMSQLSKINNCKIIGQIVNAGTKILFKCNLCKKEGSSLPTVLRKQKWCPNCEGHIEETNLITNILKTLKLEYIENYSIEDIEDTEFDYYVDTDPPILIDYLKPDSNKRINIVRDIFFRYIEIDQSASEEKITNDLKDAILSDQDIIFISSSEVKKDHKDIIKKYLPNVDKKLIEVIGDRSFKIDLGQPREKDLKKYVSYCRISTEEQVSGMSMETQMILAKEHADKYGFLKAHYLDFALSGGKFDTRPAYRKMVLDLKAGDEVFVTDISRLGRNIKEGVNAITNLKDRHIYVYVQNLQQSTSTESGYMMIALYLLLSDSEKKTIIERIRRAMGTMSNQGQLRSRPPFGWKFVSHDLPFVKNEDEWKTIEAIRDMRKNCPHYSINRICEELDKDPVKYPKRKAKKWYPSLVKSIMLNNGMEIPRCDHTTYVPRVKEKKKPESNKTAEE